jgi:hypothetical protein
LTKQCRNMDVPIINSVEEFKEVYERSSVVMDTIFGKLHLTPYSTSKTTGYDVVILKSPRSW